MIKTKLLLFIVVILVASCTSTRPVARTTTKPKVTTKKPPVTQSKNENRGVIVEKETNPKANAPVNLEATSNVKTYADEIKLYIDSFKEIAQNNMRAHGIPASITLAQGILESGAGKGKLAMTANNHFGIKCHSGWKGETVNHDDDAAQECFRKYEHPSESYRDHSLFLTSRARYSNLFKLGKDDYKAWAKGLKAAGYATDVKYPDKLISLIQRFDLNQYDDEVLQREFKPAKKELIVNNGINYYKIQAGDTLYSLSKRFNLTVDELKKINKMSDNALSIGQQIKVK